MALYKYHYIELDTKRSPRISFQNIVAGETGNRLVITVTNNGETVDMSEKESGEFIYRVCLKIDSDLGTRRQDSAQENSGITFIEAATGDHGKINILLSKDSFTAGMNRCRIEIFSTRAEEDDTLIISAEWTFRAAGNPTGENAGSVYPSLIALETELNQLKTDTTAAKDAATAAATSANSAASSANSAASAANSAANNAATSANNASTSATNAATSANSAASSANDAAGTLNALLENIDVDPTQNSNNLVKSGGVWYALEQKQDILVVDNAPTHGSDHFVTSGTVYDAINAAAPLTLHVASTTQDQSNPHKATITFEAGETDLIYSGAQTRDMEFDFVVPWDIQQPTVHLRKTGFDEYENGTTAVSFIGHLVGHTVAGGFSVPTVCAIVYFINNGTYYGTIVGKVS